MSLPKELEQVMKARGGSILGKKTILKSDHFPGCQNKRLSPQIEGAPNYRQDKGLRELAAEALSSLVKYDPEYFASVVMEKLIPCTLSSDPCMRHGATLAAGELVLALHKCN